MKKFLGFTMGITAMIAANSLSAGDLDAKFNAVLQSSFVSKNIATTDRLYSDGTNQACSEALGEPLDDLLEAKYQAENLSTIIYPTDGNYLGDWKKGEKIAQSGKGMTWRDKKIGINGGNCYNCHKIGPDEISYGTIGPSLESYGKNLGFTGANDAESQEILKEAWRKLYNAKYNNACSFMPRFGTNKILNTEQLKDIMALLFDPASPINQ